MHPSLAINLKIFFYFFHRSFRNDELEHDSVCQSRLQCCQARSQGGGAEGAEAPPPKSQPPPPLARGGLKNISFLSVL